MRGIVKFLKVTIVVVIGLIAAAAIAWETCSDLCKKMQIMDFEVKMFIQPNLTKPEMNVQTLAHVANMRDAAIAARSLVPEKVVGDPQGFADYQAAIDALVIKITNLGLAVQANDNTKAQMILDDIKMDRDSNHIKFKNKNDQS